MFKSLGRYIEDTRTTLILHNLIQFYFNLPIICFKCEICSLYKNIISLKLKLANEIKVTDITSPIHAQDKRKTENIFIFLNASADSRLFFDFVIMANILNYFNKYVFSERFFLLAAQCTYSMYDFNLLLAMFRRRLQLVLQKSYCLSKIKMLKLKLGRRFAVIFGMKSKILELKKIPIV